MLVKFDFVSEGVNLEIQLVIFAILRHWLRLEEVFVVTLRQKFVIAGRC